MSKKPIEHVVLGMSNTGLPVLAFPGAGFVCKNCGGAAPIATGITLHLLQKHAAAFTLMHEDCEKPSRQLPLPGTAPGHVDGLAVRMVHRMVQERNSELTDVPGLGSGYAEVAVPAGSSIQAQTQSEWPMCPAKCWADLWNDLAEALEPHEYEALRQNTSFVDISPQMFQELATWAWHEVHVTHGKMLEPRPQWLRDALYDAVKAHQEQEDRPLQLGERPKTRQGKTVVLHIHASNDTIPKKVPPNHHHRIVSTVDQADALRGGQYSSAKVHDSSLWSSDPNGLLAYLVREVLAPMQIKITTPAHLDGATG